MKTKHAIIASLLSVSSLWAASGSPVAEKEVMATMERMVQATIHKDVAALQKIYSDDLAYTHSVGETQNKAEVLKGIAGPTVVESIKFTDTVIHVYGNTATFHGTTDMRNGRPGEMQDNHLNVLWVLAKGPQGWQIVSRQATRIVPRQ